MRFLSDLRIPTSGLKTFLYNLGFIGIVFLIVWVALALSGCESPSQAAARVNGTQSVPLMTGNGGFHYTSPFAQQVDALNRKPQ